MGEKGRKELTSASVPQGARGSYGGCLRREYFKKVQHSHAKGLCTFLKYSPRSVQPYRLLAAQDHLTAVDFDPVAAKIAHAQQ